MKKNVLAVFAVLIAAFLSYTIFLAPSFGHDTLWNTQESLQEYLNHQHGHNRNVSILKTAKKDRIMGVIYEDEDQIYVAFFTKLLLGTRWKYDGMDMVGGDMVYLSGKWHRETVGSTCDIEIVGDNREGKIGSYALEGYEEIARDNLESDFILDIYIMDGIAALPNRNLLQQYTPDGQLIER